MKEKKKNSQPYTDQSFRDCSQMVQGVKKVLSLKSVTLMKLGTVIPHDEKIQKIDKSCDTLDFF